VVPLGGVVLTCNGAKLDRHSFRLELHPSYTLGGQPALKGWLARPIRTGSKRFWRPPSWA